MPYLGTIAVRPTEFSPDMEFLTAKTTQSAVSTKFQVLISVSVDAQLSAAINCTAIAAKSQRRIHLQTKGRPRRYERGVIAVKLRTTSNGRLVLIVVAIFVCFSPICRQQKKRDGCCCCIRLRDDYLETACGKRDILQEVMDKYVGRYMLCLPGKVMPSKSKIDKRSEVPT